MNRKEKARMEGRKGEKGRERGRGRGYDSPSPGPKTDPSDLLLPDRSYLLKFPEHRPMVPPSRTKSLAHTQPRQLTDGLFGAYGCRGLESMTIMVGGTMAACGQTDTHGTGAVVKNLHLETQS